MKKYLLASILGVLAISGVVMYSTPKKSVTTASIPVVSSATVAPKSTQPPAKPILPPEKTPPVSVGAPGMPQATQFAEVSPTTGQVLRVLVITQEQLNTGKWGSPSNWVQTKLDGSIRDRYAGVGYSYDKNTDTFVPPKPTSKSTFNPSSKSWEEPKPIKQATTTP